jgi:hypothetical protein
VGEGYSEFYDLNNIPSPSSLRQDLELDDKNPSLDLGMDTFDLDHSPTVSSDSEDEDGTEPEVIGIYAAYSYLFVPQDVRI